MGGYLAFDGFTSTFQDRLFKGYNMTIYNQILYTTLFSSAFSLFGLLLITILYRNSCFVICTMLTVIKHIQSLCPH